jgi:uncharacterized protein (DUF1800 family)
MIQWTPYPAALQYKVFRSDGLDLPFFADQTGSIAGFGWTGPVTNVAGFFTLQVVPMDTNDLLTATVLNRLAYGPTPDELDRVRAMGPQAYIDEQLAPESIQENLDIDASPTNSGWQYVTATGYASSSTLFVYLAVPGEGYVDDIMLVSGTNAGVGLNLVRNGGFESPLTTNDWAISSDLTNSAITTNVAHSGNASLHLVASAAGTTTGSIISQVMTPTLSSAQQYTLSYWYWRSTNAPSSLIVRLAGSGIVSSPDSLLTRLELDAVSSIDDLRAWFGMHAVRSQRQLFEILTQFLDNHFVTQYSKSAAYFNTFYPDSSTQVQLATSLEFREITRWRQALLNPACTFYDLLKISAESPAMIIYLDTVNSKGNGSNIANENYARELMELFTFGVDNGYDQNDITVMSRAWTGWSLELVDSTNVFNPFAARSTQDRAGTTTNFTAITNLVGVWAFNFKSGNHNTTAKTIYPGKIVPARFGPPWAGTNYQLYLPARTGTNGIQDGYDVINHLANHPFTEEFISVKLCRVFVHDNFAIGYDFTDPNLSPEGQLVHQCMLAWENSAPKGQIRAVLGTIFNSDLFRGNGASMQKVKTPFEFVTSAIRALRISTTNGFTADSDGYSFIVPMARMGNMNLFDRDQPDGYPEAGPPWISAGTLNERLRFVQTALMSPTDSNHNDGVGVGGINRNFTDPVALVKNKLTSTQRSDAGAVADYFLGILFPGEGKANLDLYRASAISFLNTANDGVTPSPFSSLAMTGNPSPYETRLRGMVATLMTFQRFQEQ